MPRLIQLTPYGGGPKFLVKPNQIEFAESYQGDGDDCIGSQIRMNSGMQFRIVENLETLRNLIEGKEPEEC